MAGRPCTKIECLLPSRPIHSTSRRTRRILIRPGLTALNPVYLSLRSPACLLTLRFTGSTTLARPQLAPRGCASGKRSERRKSRRPRKPERAWKTFAIVALPRHPVSNRTVVIRRKHGALMSGVWRMRGALRTNAVLMNCVAQTNSATTTMPTILQRLHTTLSLTHPLITCRLCSKVRPLCKA